MKALAYEKLMWRSLYRWIRRRPLVDEPDAIAFGNAAHVTPFIWAFIALSAVELVAVDLLLQRWTTIRITADVLGVYGLIWMVGLLAMARSHPHVITPDTLYLRSGASTEVQVPRALVDEVRLHRRYYTSNLRLQVETGAASIVTGSQTQIDIHLHTPLTVGDTAVTEIRIGVDDTDAFLTAARAQTVRH